jgi:hypothetical protein
VNTDAVDPLGFPASVLPSDTSAPPAFPSSHSTRSKRRKPRSGPQEFPRWFEDDRKQAIAEWLAFNWWLDKTLGVEPSIDRYPYNEYRPTAVASFLARLSAVITPTHETIPT